MVMVADCLAALATRARKNVISEAKMKIANVRLQLVDEMLLSEQSHGDAVPLAGDRRIGPRAKPGIAAVSTVHRLDADVTWS